MSPPESGLSAAEKEDAVFVDSMEFSSHQQCRLLVPDSKLCAEAPRYSSLAQVISSHFWSEYKLAAQISSGL